jgi:dihydroorotate dehydrogenase
MLYDRLRPLIFRLDAETAHDLTLSALDKLVAVGAARLLAPDAAERPCKVMGLAFPNPLGLAAGLDKNAEHVDSLAALGFGFIEVGTVTPRAQPGNPKPRLFRIPEHAALVNRMGFNNGGVERLLANLGRSRYRGILGINIGKNFDTPLERAIDDYLYCLRMVYPRASYVVVNISSPNTKDLRRLQQTDHLNALLAGLKAEQNTLATKHGKQVPLAVKIAPDLEPEELHAMAQLFREHALDAVIATNTTISRAGVESAKFAQEAGGLSGAPLQARSTEVIKILAAELRGQLPIIGVGGILDAATACEKFRAGASLVQIYTGLIYRGPGLIKEIRDGLAQMRNGRDHVGRHTQGN